MLTIFLRFPTMLGMLAPSAYSTSKALCWGQCGAHMRAACNPRATKKWAHITLCVLEILPVIGQLISLIELGIARACFNLVPLQRGKSFRAPAALARTVRTQSHRTIQLKPTYPVYPVLNERFLIGKTPQTGEEMHNFYLMVEMTKPRGIISLDPRGENEPVDAFLYPEHQPLSVPPCQTREIPYDESFTYPDWMTHLSLTLNPGTSSEQSIDHFICSIEDALEDFETAIEAMQQNTRGEGPLIVTFNDAPRQDGLPNVTSHDALTFVSQYDGIEGSQERLGNIQASIGHKIYAEESAK